MKAKKKPVIIEAELISDLIMYATNHWDKLPDWVKENYENGKILFIHDHIEIFTAEGRMRGEKDDYLIRGIKGEIYPCKPDIFKATYEIIDS
jgi:hypothetical protein